jgi:ligand-binding SRPBCC domain-containing protein
MRVYTLQREQRVVRPLERVFPFFSQPEKLALITPPTLDFQLLTPRPVVMEMGRTIDYTIRVAGLPIRWRTLITRFDPPWCFVDEQLSGPYSFWHHTHRFRQDEGETVLHDEVRYALPEAMPAPLRDLLHSLYVRPELEHIFNYRQQVFARLFGSARPCGTCTPGAAPATEENAL